MSLAAAGIAALGVVAAVVLALTGHPIPVELWTVITFALGGHLGLTAPQAMGKGAG